MAQKKPEPAPAAAAKASEQAAGLKTALALYGDGFTQPERQLYDFFNNDSLHDVELIHPTSGAHYK